MKRGDGYTLHEDCPAFASRADKVAARPYNLWRLAGRRLGLPLRFALPGLKGLELVLTDAAWICVDPHLNDMPIIAWTGFQVAERATLHRPIACELKYFHFGASMVRARVLELMETLLDERLRAS
ncbi:MAG TPA: hypothetical protein PLZ79_04725 [Burkholderiales bacterium]|nr:hypothetical protein [Betaproteobacteria bacterium]HQR52551.1 hypothetical protein [Burkholderiales bacterium]